MDEIKSDCLVFHARANDTCWLSVLHSYDFSTYGFLLFLCAEHFLRAWCVNVHFGLPMRKVGNVRAVQLYIVVSCKQKTKLGAIINQIRGFPGLTEKRCVYLLQHGKRVRGDYVHRKE